MNTARTLEVGRAATAIRPLTMADVPELSAFLRERFAASAAARFAAEDVLRWKYLVPTASEADSFVVERDGRIVAHAGVLLATFRSPVAELLRCATIIDWAADASVPGAGLSLYRYAMGQADATFLVGGAAVTRGMVERLGFRPAFHAQAFTRWFRPVREFLRRPKTVRSALRLAHGVARTASRGLAPVRDWSIDAVERFDTSILRVVSFASGTHIYAHRSLVALNHRLACPARRMRGHVLRRHGEIAGLAVSSVGHWDAKILTLQVMSGDAVDWASAYSLVTQALADDASVCRVSVMTSAPLVKWAMDGNHFWRGTAEPVLVHDVAGRLTAVRDVDICFFDSDLDYCSE